MNDGGLNYPSEQGHIPDGTWNQTYDPGQTRHQSLAETAMGAFCDGRSESANWIAMQAHLMADAMLAEEERRATESAGSGPPLTDAQVAGEDATPDVATMLFELLYGDRQCVAKRELRESELGFLVRFSRIHPLQRSADQCATLARIYRDVFG